MTHDEFMIFVKKQNAWCAPPATPQSVAIANTTLQHMRAAILPQQMIDLYTQCNGINLGNGYIFGTIDAMEGPKFLFPSIQKINNDLIGFSRLRGHTVFGRNDLFWFSFDSFGNFFMIDNLTLNPLRKYDDAWRALSDCLAAGKI